MPRHGQSIKNARNGFYPEKSFRKDVMARFLQLYTYFVGYLIGDSFTWL